MELKHYGKILTLIEKEFLKIFELIFEKKTSKRVFDIEDNVILGLYDGMIKRTDTILTLYSLDKSIGCQSIARSIFEAKVFLIYILEKYTKDRARAYHYSCKYKTMKLGKELMNEDLKGSKMRGFLNISLEDFKRNVGNVLAEESTGITEKYDRYVGKNKNWYQHKNLRELCQTLNLTEEYDLLFRIFSDETHAKDAASQFKITSIEVENNMGLIEFKQEDIAHVVSFCMLTLVEMTRMILKYYNLSSSQKRFDRYLELTYRQFSSR